MDHPFTPPARIPASLPKSKTPKTEKKSKTEYFGTIPQNANAHLTEEELQQLTRSSMEASRPIFSRSHSRESRESRSSKSSINCDRRYGRSGSISSMPVSLTSRKSTIAAGLTGLDLMQAQYSSSSNVVSSSPHTRDIPQVNEPDIKLPIGSPSGSVSSATSNSRGRDLKYSTDGPSPPVLRSIPAGSKKYLTGADLHMPPDGVPASVHHLIGADLKLPDNGGPVIQSPFPIAPHHIDELEKSASVAALLLEKMESKPPTPVDRLPIDDSTAPIPSPLPIRKDSVKTASSDSSESVIITPATLSTVIYEMSPPPSVVALISNLGSQGDSSSDPNWPLPAKTPVYTFIPPPPSQSPVASSLEASIPSNIPSPIESPVTAAQQPQISSFIPPPHTVPIGSPATPMQELPDDFSISTPQNVFRLTSPGPVVQQAAVGAMIPPPYVVATSAAPYNQPFSTTSNSMAPPMTPPSQPQQRVYLNPTPIAPYTTPVSTGLHDMTVHNLDSDAAAVTQEAVGAMIPPPYNVGKTASQYNQPLSATPNSTLPSQDYQSALSREASTQQQHQPYTSMPDHGMQHDPNADALAAARAAYSHANQSMPTSTHQPSRPSTYIPLTMASRYRNSVDYNQATDSQSTTAMAPSNSTGFRETTNAPPSTPFTQPAAYMPPYMASHYRESSAVAEAKAAYDQPNNAQLFTAASAEQDAQLGISSKPSAIEPHNQPSAYMPPSMATHYRESSAVAEAKKAYDKAAKPSPHTMVRTNSGRAAPGALYGAIAGFNQAFNGQKPPQAPIELSAVNNASVQPQSPIPRVPVPVHGNNPVTYTTPAKPQSVAVFKDAALAPQAPFRHLSKLNHSPNLHPNTVMHGQPPNRYYGNPIDRQLPANAPSLHIETVPSFPRPVAKEASFWRRRKKALIILLVIVLIGIGVGIVFVAHSFYTRWGGVGFLKKREAEVLTRRSENFQQTDGEAWRRRQDRDEKNGGQEKGLLENMLVGGYKRGWGTDYKDDYQPAQQVPEKFPHIVQIIPVGSTTNLPGSSPYGMGSSWWNERVNEMHKRGEEIISAHPHPEDALKHAAVLAQRFLEEIKARIEASGNGPSCPPACRSESDVEASKVLACDYVDRVPIDVANEYDVKILMSSMDSVEMKRPAQEVAMLAAQGYVARLWKVVLSKTNDVESGRLDARGVLSEEDIKRLFDGKDVPEPEGLEIVTETVTRTRVNIGAPTGLSPQDQAKQFAPDYVDSAPYEVESKQAKSSMGKRNTAPALHETDTVQLAESLAAKRWAARKSGVGVLPLSSLRTSSPQEDAKGKAAIYAGHVPTGQPLSESEKAKINAGFYARQFREEHETLAKKLVSKNVMKPGKLMAAALFERLKVHGEEGELAHERSKRNAGHYARQVPRAPIEPLADLFVAGLKSEKDVGRWSDEGEVRRRSNPACEEGSNGCGNYGHPEICCPPSYTCYKSTTTNSGIICCPGSKDCSNPSQRDDALIQVFCPSSTIPCPAEAGGGCCASLDQCSPRGCLEFESGFSPSDSPAIAITETRSITISASEELNPSSSEVEVEQGATITRTVTQLVAQDVRVKTTKVKDGEVVRGPEETLGSGKVAKPQGFKPKTGGGRRWEEGRKMVWGLAGVAAFMAMM